MKLNYIERMRCYNELKQDFDLQCIENSRKQDTILELRRKITELEEENKLLTEKLEASDREYDKLIQSLSKKEFEEVANDRKYTTTKQTHSRKTSK